MLDLQDKYADLQPNEFAYQGVPLFEDVFAVFNLLTEGISGTRLQSYLSRTIYEFYFI